MTLLIIYHLFTSPGSPYLTEKSTNKVFLMHQSDFTSFPTFLNEQFEIIQWPQKRKENQEIFSVKLV